MSLIRWEPFYSMDDMFKGLPALFGRLTPFAGYVNNTDWSPSVDISESEEEYLIRAAVPAVKKEDVSVTVNDGMLTLSGERRQKEEQNDEKFHKVENFYGSFSRSFALPEGIDAASIRAESKEGVLTIHVPKAKAEVTKPTTIKVQ
jgi:HSP20 family protein